MATLHISELVQLPTDYTRGALAQVAELPPVAQQVVTFTTSTQSSAINSGTRFVRVFASVACYIEVGANPTATSSSLPLAAGAAEYFGVAPGLKIAALAA